MKTPEQWAAELANATANAIGMPEDWKNAATSVYASILEQVAREAVEGERERVRVANVEHDARHESWCESVCNECSCGGRSGESVE